MTVDIREFLEARLNEEARDADLISSGGYGPQRWRLGDGTIGWGEAELTIGDEHDTDRYVPVRAVDRTIGGGPVDDEDSGVVAWVRDGRNEHLHVVRYGPARVVRDVEAKRRLIARCVESIEGQGIWGEDSQQALAEDTLALLAHPYSDHPDYDPSWSPENVVPHV